jgi:hypothetical protein
MTDSERDSVEASVVDLFCGAGRRSIDIDETCRIPYEKSISAPFLRCEGGIAFSPSRAEAFRRGEGRLAVGCAPCQPFSTYNQKNDDPQMASSGRFRGVGRGSNSGCHLKPWRLYNWLAMLLKVLLRLVPTKVNAAMAATAINAAINPYSIAVTPRLSLTSLEIARCFKLLIDLGTQCWPFLIIISAENRWSDS